jgi:Tfp pilus assembly protein PilV
VPFTHPRQRSGFILAEALIALLIFGVVFIALEGSLALVLRAVADSEREAIASRLAESQRERVFAAACEATSGSDSANGVTLAWTVSPVDGLARVGETTTYHRRTGDRMETYDALGRCQ